MMGVSGEVGTEIDEYPVPFNIRNPLIDPVKKYPVTVLAAVDRPAAIDGNDAAFIALEVVADADSAPFINNFNDEPDLDTAT